MSQGLPSNSGVSASLSSSRPEDEATECGLGGRNGTESDSRESKKNCTTCAITFYLGCFSAKLVYQTEDRTMVADMRQRELKPKQHPAIEASEPDEFKQAGPNAGTAAVDVPGT